MNNKLSLRVGFILTVIAVITACFIVIIVSTNVVASDQYSNKEFNVVSHTIVEGDTLWSIANTYYSKEYKTIEHYIGVIKECNHMESDKITIGMNLIIPFYNKKAYY